jgi:hypothetical protein
VLSPSEILAALVEVLVDSLLSNEQVSQVVWQESGPAPIIPSLSTLGSRRTLKAQRVLRQVG